MKYGQIEPLIERTCNVCRTYAERAAAEGAYKPLLLICGDPEVLGYCTERINGPMEGYNGRSLFEGDEAVHGLFDVMNPNGHHRDGAISFDPEGKVVDFGVRIIYPEFKDTEMFQVYKEIAEIKGELGTRHISALHGSMIPGVDVTVAISQDAGTVIPFRNGNIIREYVWKPDSKVIYPALSL